MSRTTTGLICAALLALFAALSFLAVRSKSPTYDEPLHAASAWMSLRDSGDFRINTEDPPLFKFWAAIPNRSTPFDMRLAAPKLDEATNDAGLQWPFVVALLYRTAGNVEHLDAFFARGHAMMLILAVALGAIVAWWSWELGGAVAAIVATAAFALDPNFLAHAPLIKNDVALSLVMLALARAVWGAGRKLTLINGAAIALLCAAAVTTKFSGLLLGPIVAVLLILRAIDQRPWPTFWRTLEWRSEKLVVAAMLLVACAAVSYVGIWSVYGFRFAPTRDPSVLLNMKRMQAYTAASEFELKNGGAEPTPEQVANWKPSPTARIVMTLEDMRFLPQAWLHGFLYTYQSTLTRDTYLLGKYSDTGWWYYFPLAMLFKTPLAILVAFALAMAIAVIVARRSGSAGKVYLNWTAACLAIPPAIYLFVAMAGNLNLGLRHVLPVYPFLYIGVGLAAAKAWELRPRVARWVVLALALVLAIETFAAFPNYIPFFNLAAGGARGGLRLLGDSNLDWGQDLPLLAEWQRKHPGVNLYLVYFGLADPWAYNIEYTNFPNGYKFGPTPKVSMLPGVLAISATHLQGIYQQKEARDIYGQLREEKPIDVLGGSIYLYQWPPGER